MKTEYKHIYFEQVKPDKPRKTEIWDVRNKAEENLGVVKWHSAWRQYCWFCEYDTIMAKGCLDDLSDFIKQLMDARKGSG